MNAPRCGFLRESDGFLVPCAEQATLLALVAELGDYVPACEECAAGKQTRRVAE